MRLCKAILAMGVSVLRKFVGCIMVILCPLSLTAADTGSAVLHSEGGVWVNGFEISGSTVVFPGDLLETKPGFSANVDAEGSSIAIQPESVVKFQGTFLSLEHGSVSVGTSTSMSVHVSCLKVEPVSSERTQYDVADVSGSVQVAARKNDVNLTQGGVPQKTPAQTGSPLSSVVHEGQQVTRDEATACGAAPRPGSVGNGLNTKWLEIGGGIVGGGIVLCILLCKGSGSSGSVSPSNP
jgi:hypothetical protein